MVRLFTTPRSQQGDREGNRIKQICGGKGDKSHDGVRRKRVNFDLAFSPFLVKLGGKIKSAEHAKIMLFPIYYMNPHDICIPR